MPRNKPHNIETKRKIGIANKIAIKKLWENEEYKKHMIKVHLGQKAWNKGKKLPPSWNKGKKLTQEHLLNLKKSKIGYMGNISSLTHFSGKNHYNWKGGITPINELIRKSKIYKEWRVSVFERDKYTCQECGKNGCVLHADHIKPFAYYPELRFEKSNGRTLCIDCHKKTNTYGYKAKSLFVTNLVSHV